MDENELIRSCKVGDKNAFQLLYNNYSGLMFSICKRYLSTETEAEDAFQDAFVKVFTKIDSYESRGSLEGWMRRIAVNTAINYYKKTRRTRSVLELDIDEVEDLKDEDLEEATSLVTQIPLEVLHNLIAELPEKYNLVFNLYAIEGKSHSEIAEIMNISESTSRSQYTRARQRLVKMLKAIQ